jgi:thiol-disulfide isomerase/thioredoxin
MSSTTRRATLAGAGALVIGTVAAVTLLRKPRVPVQVIHTPVADKTIALQPVTALKPTDPPAPPADAIFTDAAGTPHRIADFAGKGLVVNCWATWCLPCVAEMPALQALAQKVAGDNILVLALSSDRGGADVVRKFYAAHDITALPIWLDPKAAASGAWGVAGLPTTLIIDRQGRERGRFEGAVDWAADATVSKIRQLVG